MAMGLLLVLAAVPLLREVESSVGGYVFALLLLRFAALRWPRLTPNRWHLMGLTLAGGAVVYSAYATLIGQEAGTALLATMLTLKVLEVRGARDLRIATALFGFLLVSQFLFSQSAGLGLYFVALMVGNFALMADLSGRDPARPIAGALRVAGRLSLQALPLALVLFVLFPRLSGPLWSINPPVEKARTGVKDWMEPGSITDLILSGELAFRVRFEGAAPRPDQLYWRGPVLWRSEGRRWVPGAPVLPPPVPKSLGERLAYSVTLEPTGQRSLFALDLPAEAPPRGRMTGDFQVLAERPVVEPMRYRMVSALSYHTGKLSAEEERAGLALPGNVTRRMRELVAGWQASGISPEELVDVALAHFREEPFYYTLAPPRLGTNPVDQFLFQTRRGFCEHYAGAFALLMRIAGVPSRVVLGYHGGELNPMGGHYIIRQSDAHAWTEVWLADRGWVRVDPTAAIAPERVEASDLLSGLAGAAPARFQGEPPAVLLRWLHQVRLLADAADARWYDWVVGYSNLRQQRLLDVFGLGALREYGLAAGMLLAATIVLGLIVTTLTRGDAKPDALEQIYRRFCRRLARIGLHRAPSEGPLAFGRRVSALRPDLRPAVDGFLALYLPLRYGGREPPGGLPALRRALAGFHPRSRPG
jgi:transglutaminase-like putative cysteine protease